MNAAVPRVRRVAGGLGQVAAADRAQLIGLVCPKEEPTAMQIRRWAARTGVPCPPRGVISRTVRAAYDAAHPNPNERN